MHNYQWGHGMGWGSCGCGCDPLTKEEKIALLERKEKFLKQKLEFISKLKEELKSGKAEKAEKRA